ncbi:hypothetical protein CEP54_015509, partial [Fusarium duplospermum]
PELDLGSGRPEAGTEKELAAGPGIGVDRTSGTEKGSAAAARSLAAAQSSAAAVLGLGAAPTPEPEKGLEIDLGSGTGEPAVVPGTGTGCGFAVDLGSAAGHEQDSSLGPDLEREPEVEKQTGSEQQSDHSELAASEYGPHPGQGLGLWLMRNDWPGHDCHESAGWEADWTPW